jgi:hypothetical protein
MNKNVMYYNYAFKQLLIKDIFEYRDINKYLNIYLSIYKINILGKSPFLQFLLSNNGLDLLSLPKLKIFNFSIEKFISYSKLYISGILEIQNFQNLMDNIEFDGFYEYEENLYMFFDISDLNICIGEIYSNNPVRFALVDEIINHKNICNIPISLETVNFFTKNESINYLFDKNNDTYEIPLVGFTGKKTPQQLNFTFIFGESPRDKLAIFGSNYYLTDFNNAVRQGGWSSDYKPEYLYDKLITDNENGRYIKGGLVRFAVFMGKTKYIENNLDLPNDESNIKKQKLNNSILNNKYEILTMRISDHDSIWRNEYDSLYLGNVELDDGNYIQEYPVIVIKDYKQQLSLSYHFIDKSYLGDKFNPCCDYMIV